MRERVSEIIEELRDLVEQAQASMNDRPVLQRLLTAVREKVAEAKAEDEDGDENEDQPDEQQP
jgi:hypothetical protein